jgi:hypothetical protein
MHSVPYAITHLSLKCRMRRMQLLAHGTVFEKLLFTFFVSANDFVRFSARTYDRFVSRQK